MKNMAVEDWIFEYFATLDRRAERPGTKTEIQSD